MDTLKAPRIIPKRRIKRRPLRPRHSPEPNPNALSSAQANMLDRKWLYDVKRSIPRAEITAIIARLTENKYTITLYDRRVTVRGGNRQANTLLAVLDRKSYKAARRAAHRYGEVYDETPFARWPLAVLAYYLEEV